MSGVVDEERFRNLLLSFPAKAIVFLYDQYYHSLIKIARGLTHDQSASEDIVQETFVHVWENHKLLGQHHDRSIQHYLVRVVKNKSISYYKRMLERQEQKAIYLNGQRLDTRDHSIETDIIQLEINHELRRIIVTFPRREKECLLMKIDEEMTLDQIAKRLNVSKKAVERSLTSANKRLRQYWENRR